MSFITTVEHSVGFSEDIEPAMANPMDGMGAGDVWTFISGQEDGNRVGDNWEGLRFRVDEVQTARWTPQQMYQLKVITSSFESWNEVMSVGQPIPGQHASNGCLRKLAQLEPKVWPAVHDAQIRSLESPRLEDRQAALQNLMLQCGRSEDEIVGRCMLFARSNRRLNLGNAPYTGQNDFAANVHYR